MNKNQSLLLYGILIIVAGLLMVVLRTHTILTYSVAFCMITSALFALITAYKSRAHHVRIIYHETHALAMITYSVILLFLCTTLESFIQYTTFYFLFYFFSEVIFCNWLFNLKTKVSLEVLVKRIFIAFIIGVGTVVVISSNGINQELKLMGLGVLMCIIGINTLYYKPIIKILQLPNETNV